MDAVWAASLGASELRAALVSLALEWERRYGVAPAVTTAVSEHDAALLVGHTPETAPSGFAGLSAVSRGWDFMHAGLRYQVKANRPSGRPNSRVTLVAKASNYEWDRLVWLLYDREFRLQEAWEWGAAEYEASLGPLLRVCPPDMRRGRRLFGGAVTEPGSAPNRTAGSASADLLPSELQDR